VLDIRHDWLAVPSNAERWGDRIKEQLPNDFCILQGQRAGKSVATAMYCTYILHRYLIMPDPAAYFGLMPDVGALYGTFVSVGLEQVQSNLWQPFVDMLGTSPWFKTYHDLLKDIGKEQSQEIFVQRDTYLWYKHKRLGISYRASDQRRLRGKTRAFAAVDELSWLRKGKLEARDSEESMQLSGPGVIRALNNSLMSVRMAARGHREHGRQGVIDAYLMTISSPSSKLDTMMMRAAGAPSSPRRYYVKRTTWQSNPRYTEAALREEVGDMAESKFQTDFACNPPYSDAPWWPDKNELLGLCVPEKQATRLWSGSVETVDDGLADATYKWMYYKIAQTIRDRYTPRVLALDVGLNNCSFSWSTAHLDKDTVQIDDVGELAPADGHRIHFGLMWVHVIEKLIKALRFEHVVWDRWESSRYVADLRTEHKVRAEQYTATYRDARALRTDMRNARVRFPPPEVDLDTMSQNLVDRARTPRAHLLYQVMTVRDPGHAIPTKPDGGTDDSFRTLLLAHATIIANRDTYRHVKRDLRGPTAVSAVGVCSTMHGQGRRISPGGVVLGQHGTALGVLRRRSY
jgi:hypothetical protein